MHATDVIRRPLVTEKATIDSEENNRYAFEVDRRATKDMIRKAVQDLYTVSYTHLTLPTIYSV